MILSEALPSGVPAVVVTVSVEVFEVASVIVTEVGLKLAEAPAGNPVALKLTVPVKPADGVIVTVYCALPLGTVTRVAGETFMSKSGVDENGAEVTSVL